MFNKTGFASRVKELRNKKGVSQTVIAQLLGVTKTQISDIENAKTSTSLEKAVALADFFDVSLDYLVGRSDNPARH